MPPAEKTYWEERADKGFLYIAMMPCRLLLQLVLVLLTPVRIVARALLHVPSMLARACCTCRAASEVQPTSIVPVDDGKLAFVEADLDIEAQASIVAFGDDKPMVMEHVTTLAGTPINVVGTSDDKKDAPLQQTMSETDH